VINLLEPDTGEDVESRPAVGLDLLRRHDAQHEAFAAEIAAARRKRRGLPLAVDELEVGGFMSLRHRGLDIRDAADLLDEACEAAGPERSGQPKPPSQA
jgi:hypothetical protein